MRAIYYVFALFHRSRLSFYAVNKKYQYDHQSADDSGNIMPMSQVITNPTSIMPRCYGQCFKCYQIACRFFFMHLDYAVGDVHSVEVDDFKAHVQKMHSNDDYLFSEEYSVSFLTHKHVTNNCLGFCGVL